MGFLDVFGSQQTSVTPLSIYTYRDTLNFCCFFCHMLRVFRFALRAYAMLCYVMGFLTAEGMEGKLKES